MGTDVNKHGLSRSIPGPVKREIRQACGFGCVKCGLAIVEYEHVDPPFHDAKAHEAANMTLLCPGCHGAVTRGHLSKDTVKQLMKKPYCLQTGFSHGAFDVQGIHPAVEIGGYLFERTTTILEVCSTKLFEIKPPEHPGGPFRLGALVLDESGAELLRIEENEWKSWVDNWDVVVEGPRITIRRAPRDIALVLRTDPPNRLVVERLSLAYKNLRFFVKANGDFEVSTSAGAVVDGQRGAGIAIQGANVGMRVDQAGNLEIGG